VWSFHRYYLSVASAVLHPMYNGSTTLNYKTVFKTNALLAGYVTGYGAKLTGDTTVYADGVANGFVLSSGAAQRNELVTALAGTLKTANSQEVNGVNATAIVRVCAFLQLKDGTQITSAQVSCSLKDVVIAVNESTVLTDGQKSALGRMYQTFRSIFDAWTDADLSNIKSYISYI